MSDQGAAPDIRRFGHPGAGRRKGRHHPKGRQIDPVAAGEVGALLGDRPRDRDLLIEHLHLIQDAHGHLSARHLAALAAEMGLAQTEVYEVATFYAHFDVVLEGETPPPGLTIRVCDSLSCALAGAEALVAALEAETDPADIRVLRAPCMGRCEAAPVAEVGHNHVTGATVQTVMAAAAGDTHPKPPACRSLEAYRADGGYGLLGECLSGARTVDAVIETCAASAARAFRPDASGASCAAPPARA